MDTLAIITLATAAFFATNLAKHETKHPCLVVEVVKHVKPSMLHAVGHAWITSPTLLAAFQRCGRAHSMLCTNVEFNLTRMQGPGTWWLISRNQRITPTLLSRLFYKCREYLTVTI